MAVAHSDGSSAERHLLRHALATIAYRASRAILDPPATYATLQIGPGSRTPAEILAHMGDLMDWALSLARGGQTWHTSTPLAWELEVDRFFAAVGRLDAYLASDAPLAWSPDRLLQAPIADTLTHVGQLTMLRRMAGRPVRGEHYGEARIEVGRVGRDQAAARVTIE